MRRRENGGWCYRRTNRGRRNRLRFQERLGDDHLNETDILMAAAIIMVICVGMAVQEKTCRAAEMQWAGRKNCSPIAPIREET